MVRNVFLSIGMMVVLMSVAWAQDVSVQASVAASKISLKEAGQLTVTVVGAKDNIDPPEFSNLDGLEIRYLGPSTQVSIVNGQYSSQRSFVYNVFPSKTGRFQIPAVTLTVDGQSYSTQSIDIDVVDAPAVQQAADPSNATTDVQELKDKIYLHVSLFPGDIYEGQKVPVSVKLYVSGVPLRNIQFPSFDKNGFNMDAFPQPEQKSELVNGVKYDVVDFKTFIYPTRTGELSLGPVHLEASILYKSPSRSSSGNPFNDDFFNSFFDNYQVRPLTVSAQPLTFNVLPLPEEGKPTGFTGAVGQLGFSATVSPDHVQVGDPVTVRLKVEGSANLKSIQMPSVNDSRFKVYDPQIKDEANAKTLEQVVIPTSEDVTAVPAISFTYFDPQVREYKTQVQGPFPLTVTPTTKGQEFKAVGFNELPHQTSLIQVEQVDYVQKYIKQPIKALIRFCRTLYFWMGVLGVGVVIVGWMIWSKFRERLNKDTVFARRMNATKNAKEGLTQAEKLLKSGDSKAFYGILHKTLSAYVRDKGLADEAIPELKVIYEVCDLVRFAGGQGDPSQMRQHLSQAYQIIQKTLSSKHR